MPLDRRCDQLMTRLSGADAEPLAAASRWLVGNVDLLPGSGRALDVACGNGRHALLLAAAGLVVTAVDRDEVALERLRSRARRLDLDVHVEAMDLEAPGVDLGRSAYDLVVVTRYLHRPLFPSLLDAIAPGGVLVYETFLVSQAERGHPRNPAFLLEPGELLQLVHPLEVLRSCEGDVDGAMLASVVARRT